VEEERRVFHVALTRASATVQLVAERGAGTQFVDELSEIASAHGDEPPDARATLLRSGSRPQKRPGYNAVVGPALEVGGEPDDEVFAALKAWRRDRARGDGVPAYVILHDSHLRAIAAARPRSLEALARCPGIGATKLERYGDEIVAIVNDVSP
jgi:DNA helicase-2/ATP-dependent DNA helicase PcrA